jgi:Ser-tRNA(Ala) deacylase AlaX
MIPNQGRLQTGEHVLAKVIQNRVKDAKVVIARFDQENEGSVDFSTQVDLKELSMEEIEGEVNDVIRKGLPVTDRIFSREDLGDEFDLSRIPHSVKEIRIVEIEGFDRRPCRDPHVRNTMEIGCFCIRKVERVGRDRYRMVFFIKNGEYNNY